MLVFSYAKNMCCKSASYTVKSAVKVSELKFPSNSRVDGWTKGYRVIVLMDLTKINQTFKHFQFNLMKKPQSPRHSFFGYTVSDTAIVFDKVYLKYTVYHIYYSFCTCSIWFGLPYIIYYMDHISWIMIYKCINLLRFKMNAVFKSFN